MRLFFFALLGAVALHAAALKNPQETLQLADNVMVHFARAEFHKGLALAKPYWPMPEAEIDGLEASILKQWPIVDSRFGQATGWEFVKEERIGSSFVRYYYLHKFQNHALYWQFSFYKPIRDWVVNGITFKDDVDILYEKAHSYE